jgi:serine/threonine-protein kinase RsbW
MSADALPPAADYVIRPFEAADAPGVVACVRRVYGDSYVIHKELYDPEQVVRLNETGRLASVVALTPAGEVVGHYAVERPDLGPIGETGEAMVLPEHQHHGLLERMRPVLVARARRLGLLGLFGLPVTNHVFSQRIYEHFEGYPCGVNLGLTPRTFRNTADPLGQRLSCLLYFQHLRPPPAATAVHVPARHREVVARVYKQFGVTAEFPEPGPAEGTDRIEVDCFPGLKYGVIRVRDAGPETAAAVARARRSLCEEEGAEAVFLELPLSRASTPRLCEAAEDDGFFFSGVGPYFAADGDALRLQFLNVPLDTALLQVANPFARELVAYAERERQRVRKPGVP